MPDMNRRLAVNPVLDAAPPAVRFGPGLLAYVGPGNALHVRSYDGTVDWPLEPGVTALYSAAPHAAPYDTP